MDVERVLNGGLVVSVFALVIVALVVAGVVPLPAPDDSEYEWTTVTVTDENGTELGSVRARIADTSSKRYTGLSETESLPADEGMVFVYDSEANRSFVMRRMDFALDIVFVGADGRITEIHHAPAPERTADELERYRGRAQWVLEVNRGWTTERNVTVGDRVEIDES